MNNIYSDFIFTMDRKNKSFILFWCRIFCFNYSDDDEIGENQDECTEPME